MEAAASMQPPSSLPKADWSRFGAFAGTPPPAGPPYWRTVYVMMAVYRPLLPQCISVTPRSKVKLVAKMLKAIHAQENKKAAKAVVTALYEAKRGC